MDNMLGMSWAMGAQDVGAKEAFDNTLKAIDDINNMIGEQVKLFKKLDKENPTNDIAEGFEEGAKSAGGFKKNLNGVYDQIKKVSSSFKGFMGSAQQRIMQFNVASIASNMRNLTGETGNLTNSLEAMGVANAQATRPIIAQMDLTASQMKRLNSQASSMAIALNTDASSIAEVIKSIETAGDTGKKALDVMGMSTKDWVKVTQTTGVDMQDYVALMGGLIASWDMAPDRAAGMMDAYVEIGKKTGTGLKPLQEMKQQMDDVDRIFKSLPPSMSRSADEIESLMVSTVKLSGAFKQMGANEAESVQYANEAAKMFAEQSVQMEKAFKIGGEQGLDEASPLFKFFTQLGMDWKEARELVNIGSRDAVKGMQMVNDVFQKFGGKDSPQVQYALAELQSSLGETASGLTYLAGSADVGAKALSDMNAMTVDGSSSLKKFGRDAYSSGRTLQETYDLAKESFDTTIRSIARKDVRNLVGKQIAGMREAGKELKALGSDQTWGPWMKMLSNYKQMGMGGIFASMAERSGVGAKEAAKFGAKFGLITDTISQVGSELAPIMEMVGMTGPLGPLLAVGGLVGLLAVDDTSARDLFGPLYRPLRAFKEKVIGIWDAWYPKIKDIWDNKIVPKMKATWNEDIAPAIEDMWFNRVVPAVNSAWNDYIIPFIQESAPKVGNAIWDGLKWAWNKLGEEIGSGGQGAIMAAGFAKIFGAGVVIDSVSSLGEVLGTKAGAVLASAGVGIAIGTAIWKGIEGEQNKQQKIANQMLKEESKITPGLLKSASVERLKSMRGNYEKLSQLSVIERVGAFVTGSGEAVATQQKSAQAILAKLDAELKSRAFSAGASVPEQMAKGFSESAESGKGDIEKSLIEMTKATRGQSPPEEGPLSGVGSENAAWIAGLSTAEQFAMGFYEGMDTVRMAVEQVMNDSVIFTMEEYANKMQELAEKKSFMESIAKSIVRDMGGTVTSSIDVAGETENVKRNLEAALSVPGLAGVTAAIVNEGAQTRKTIGRVITELERQTLLMSGGTGKRAQTQKVLS